MYFCFYEFLTCYCIIVVYNTLQEEKLKLRIAEAFFSQFDCNTRIGKIDFCVVQIPVKRVLAGVLSNTPTENKDIVSIL